MDLYHPNKSIPFKIVNKVLESICKITVETKEGKSYGTGFFMNYSDSLKCLMTNYHVINPSLENENIEIEIHNKKKMKLKLENRYTKFIGKLKDMAMIEIKESDGIYNDILFLDYDNNYITKGYSIYKDADVFSIEYIYWEDASCASGTIINIYEYEFDHNLSTDIGAEGCTIILLYDNINLIQVIGIHKEEDKKHKINGGIFIGDIFNKDLIKENINNNYIIGEI